VVVLILCKRTSYALVIAKSTVYVSVTLVNTSTIYGNGLKSVLLVIRVVVDYFDGKTTNYAKVVFDAFAVAILSENFAIDIYMAVRIGEASEPLVATEFALFVDVERIGVGALVIMSSVSICKYVYITLVLNLFSGEVYDGSFLLAKSDVGNVLNAILIIDGNVLKLCICFEYSCSGASVGTKLGINSISGYNCDELVTYGTVLNLCNTVGITSGYNACLESGVLVRNIAGLIRKLLLSLSVLKVSITISALVVLAYNLAGAILDIELNKRLLSVLLGNDTVSGGKNYLLAVYYCVISAAILTSVVTCVTFLATSGSLEALETLVVSLMSLRRLDNDEGLGAARADVSGVTNSGASVIKGLAGILD
jgi:hypothetical protein